MAPKATTMSSARFATSIRTCASASSLIVRRKDAHSWEGGRGRVSERAAKTQIGARDSREGGGEPWPMSIPPKVWAAAERGSWLRLVPRYGRVGGGCGGGGAPESGVELLDDQPRLGVVGGGRRADLHRARRDGERRVGDDLGARHAHCVPYTEGNGGMSSREGTEGSANPIRAVPIQAVSVGQRSAPPVVEDLGPPGVGFWRYRGCDCVGVWREAAPHRATACRGRSRRSSGGAAHAARRR